MLQMSNNEYLQEIFGADVSVLNNGDGMSNIEKRMLLSKNSQASKDKDREMNKDRKKRSNVKNYFLDADGGTYLRGAKRRAFKIERSILTRRFARRSEDI